MREILFRGKQMDGGEWVEGYLTYRYRYCEQSKKEILWPVIDCPRKLTLGKTTGIAISSIRVIPATVGQYTGQIDTKGTKIFEDDILASADFDEEDGYGVVEWREGAFEVGNQHSCGTFHENFNGAEFEVIGNIHDNPYMIEGASV